MSNYYLIILLLLAGLNAGCSVNKMGPQGTPLPIMSVTGPIPGKLGLGLTLPHEHILVDFIGADQVSPDRYNSDEVFAKVLPYLQQLRKQGCQTLVECTPAYLGRDPVLLKRLSEASGINIITNTGYYGAVKGKYLPRHAFSETAGQLADRWVQEWEQGVAGTGIRPGFIKISVDAGPLSKVNQKIVRAAALTHLRTGLTIASHTGNGEAALAQINILKENGVAAQAFIWVHAQNEKNSRLHRQAAQAGAWIEFDGIGSENIPEYVRNLQEMKIAGLLKQTLISQDAGWYRVGEPQGGAFRGYKMIFTGFLPALKTAGFTNADIKQIMKINPQRAFTGSVRKQAVR